MITPLLNGDLSDQSVIRIELVVGGVRQRALLLKRPAGVVFPDVNGLPRTDSKAADLASLAGRMYESRVLRRQYFLPSLLGEPAWDIMLALYCLSARGESLSVSGLSYAAGVPQTTSLRWGRILEERNLIARAHDPTDKRRIHMSLTGLGRKLMDDYLTSVHEKFG